MGAAEELTLTIGTRFENTEEANFQGDIVTAKGAGVFDNRGHVHGIGRVAYEAGHLTNTGEVSSAKEVNIRGSFSNLGSGKIASSGILALQGTAVPLHNEGLLYGKEHLLYEAGYLTNTGDILSDQKVDIRRDFTNGGTIGSKGILDLQGIDSSSNTGTLVGDKSVTAAFKKFDNRVSAKVENLAKT